MRLPSVLYSALLLFTVQQACAHEVDLPEVSIAQERVIECPAVLDTRYLNDGKAINQLIKQETFKDFPYQFKAVSKEFVLKTSGDLTGRYWQSEGGKVLIEEKDSRVSKVTCSYQDHYNSESHASFTLLFTHKFKIHVAGHLPQYAGENVFPPTTCLSRDEGLCDLPCTSIKDYDTPNALHCRFTPAVVLITNKIQFPKKSSPQNFGVVFAYFYLDGNARTAIPAGKSVLMPVSRPDNFALKLVTPRVGEPFTLSSICMEDSWVKNDQLYAAYGVSPHITITGKVSENGNTAINDKRTLGFGCQVSCSVLSSNCWGGLWRKLTGNTLQEVDLHRRVLLSRLGPMRDASSEKKTISQLHEDVEKADWFKTNNFTPTAEDKKKTIDELTKALQKAREKQDFLTDFNEYVESGDEALSLAALKNTIYPRVLGVAADAPSEDIKRNFRKRSLLMHPDKNPDASDHKWIQLQEAANYLEDKARKREISNIGAIKDEF